MSDLVAPIPVAPSSRAAVLPWLPTPWRALPEAAACPACGAVGELIYSLTHQYVCCAACGWQRRLISRDQRLAAALAATLTQSWQSVLDDLTKAPPDALPPVPALLWRQTGPETWVGPSRTQAGVFYSVTLLPSGQLSCACKNRWACWHVSRVRQLANLPASDPADDLYGPRP